jgi:hypothetical protein
MFPQPNGKPIDPLNTYLWSANETGGDLRRPDSADFRASCLLGGSGQGQDRIVDLPFSGCSGCAGRIEDGSDRLLRAAPERLVAAVVAIRPHSIGRAADTNDLVDPVPANQDCRVLPAVTESSRPLHLSITAIDPVLSSLQVSRTRSTPSARAMTRLCRRILVAYPRRRYDRRTA